MRIGRQGDFTEVAAVNATDSVVLREAFVEEGVIGFEQIQDAAVFVHDAFEEQLRTQVPTWAAYDFRVMMQGYLERGFAAKAEDVSSLTKLLGHAPRRYADFAKEAAQAWTKK